MYGPTETTINATGYSVPRAATPAETPIGAPLPGYTVRLLDDALHRVDIGEIGEICIGVAGVAAGYLDRPDATARAFVADPFGPPGARLYRTGDRALRQDDGLLLYRGRIDDQIKIRGQRIEIGEIETTLRSCPDVGQTAVVLSGSGAEARLTAFYTGPATAASLKTALAERLPLAARPDTFRRIAALPRLPSEKPDRDALRALAETKAAPIVAPTANDGTRIVLARAFAKVWADLLHRDDFSANANIFERGVHSLLVMRAQPLLSELAGRAISTTDVFRFPTATRLAAYVLNASATPATAVPARHAAATDIAIIGSALRVSGADHRNDFWQMLLAGDVAIREVAVSNPPPGLVTRCGVLDGIGDFDPAAFGISQKEAEELDPQQRLLLEVARAALDDAACAPDRDGPTGVFAGVGFSDYLVDVVAPTIGGHADASCYAGAIGCDSHFTTPRLAYKLGLSGPAVSIGCACSAGLAAVAQAAQALRAGTCCVALAAAASMPAWGRGCTTASSR